MTLLILSALLAVKLKQMSGSSQNTSFSWHKFCFFSNFCPVCKEDNPRIRTREVGTMLEVKTICRNVLCPRRINLWKSQPEIEGTNIPAGNLLLCFAILVAGGSATKVFRVFSHMGLACLSLGTFFKHQKVSAPQIISTVHGKLPIRL